MSEHVTAKHSKSEHHKAEHDKPEPGLTKPLYNNVGGDVHDAPSADQVREHSPRGTAEAAAKAGEGPFEGAAGALDPMQTSGDRLATPVERTRP